MWFSGGQVVQHPDQFTAIVENHLDPNERAVVIASNKTEKEAVGLILAPYGLIPDIDLLVQTYKEAGIAPEGFEKFVLGSGHTIGGFTDMPFISGAEFLKKAHKDSQTGM